MGRAAIVNAKRKDGAVFPVELSLAARRSGGRWTIAAIIRDITERRAFEHKLAHQSRLLAKVNKELAYIFRLERRGGIFILRDGVLMLAAHLGHNADFMKKHGSVRLGECLMLDLDHFKRYNDIKGHLAGDQLLQAVARSIAASVREADFVARYGGEEFFILLPETGIVGAALVAGRIGEAVRSTGITASLGAAVYDPGMGEPANLIDSADEALYIAKKKGRDRVEVFPVP